MTEVLGKLSCSDIPDFNGENVIYNDGGIISLQMDTTALRPAAGTGGKLFIDTTLNKFFRDNGSTWIDLTTPADVQGTTSQILSSLSGTTVTLSLANNPILPGLQRVKIPAGATADRPTVGTAGDHRYNSEIGKPEMFNSTDWLPYGNLLQTATSQITASSGTATIPLDSTIPQISEGFQVFTTTFTPLSTTSRIIVEADFVVSNNTAARTIMAALFKDGGANAVTVSATYSATANAAFIMRISYVFNSVSKTATTFALRLGANSTGTTYIGSAGTSTLGGVINNYFKITEII